MEDIRVLKIVRKEIDLDASPVLFKEQFTAENLARDWKVYSSEWRVENG